MTVEALLKHPALWKGRQQHEKRETFSTGHTELDAALPSGGWPVGALTELMVAHEGVGEFTLLLPALAALTQQQQWIALVAPPYTPYAPALVNAGIALERLLVIDCDDHKDAYWTAEQLLRSAVFSSVILWAEKNNDERRQRRLQLAAEQGKSWAVCYRPHHAARTSSPAGLRIVLQHSNQHLQADIIKNRGGRLSKVDLCKVHPSEVCPGKANPDTLNPSASPSASPSTSLDSPPNAPPGTSPPQRKSVAPEQAGFRLNNQTQKPKKPSVGWHTTDHLLIGSVKPGSVKPGSVKPVRHHHSDNALSSQLHDYSEGVKPKKIH